MALARAIFVSDVTLKITIKKKHYDWIQGVFSWVWYHRYVYITTQCKQILDFDKLKTTICCWEKL
jgi:hypothetical protein